MIGRLEPRVQRYAWGSHHVLAELTGRPAPTDQPEAELWMGAHESAPAGVEWDGVTTTLDRVIASDPRGVLGGSCAERFGARLPFLLKVLAPEMALSIQCHPTAAEAAEAPDGVYGDDWPKPEALVALTEFEVFAGMLPFAESSDLMTSLRVPELTAIVEWASGQPEPAKALLDGLLHLDLDVRNRLVQSVIGALQEARGDVDPAVIDAILRVSRQFPGDIGLVVLLSMRHRVLDPGDYVFVPAGVLHSYVRGTAVEILANSDNVVRAGLTPKAMNVEELLRIVDVDGRMDPESATASLDRVRSYGSDAPHFQLHRVRPGHTSVIVPGAGKPRILLSLLGSTRVEAGQRSIQLAPGGSCFVSAAEGDLAVSGDGTVYVATTG